MNTTELIELLGSVDKPREISINIEGRFWPNPEFEIIGTGDGIAGAELTLEIKGEVWEDE